MTEAEILKAFKDSGAFLEGHFLLTSGLHSPGYLQCALVCQSPELCGRLCADIAGRFAGERVDVVAGPAMGGIVLAYEMARAVKARGIFYERDDAGKMTLRRGFAIRRGERVLVAEDVMTTGGSAAEILTLVEQAGGAPVGVCALVDRGGSKRFAGRRVESALKVDLPTYKPEECPMCKQGTPAVKPGSRKAPGQ